jgi:uncharacterized protein
MNKLTTNQPNVTPKLSPGKDRIVVMGLLGWTLLPCLAIWTGLCVLKSAAWSFALYHLCLIPVIVCARTQWYRTWLLPSRSTFTKLCFASIGFSGIALIGYELFGKKVLSNSIVIGLLKEIGFVDGAFLPLCLYAIIVNPILEEIFWRGIVLNKLEKSAALPKHFGILWSSLAYAAFHYTIFRLVMYPIWAELGTMLLAGYGAILAIIYRRTGSILTTGLAHGLLTDLAAVALLLDLLRHNPSF